ncbi:MAG: DUF1376 domain-containing protein [Methylobacterium radiotolerans]
MKSEFYRMHFRDWDISTVDLSLEQEGAHLRFCHAMYNAHGPIPDSTRLLCSIWRCGNVKAAALRKALIEAGKIQIDADGSLTNKRVMAELTDRAQISAKRSAAGEQGGRAVRRSNGHEGGGNRVKVECPPSDVGVDGECPPSDAVVGACNPLKNNDLSRANASALEGREEKRREDPPKPPRGGELDRFAEFRAAYPKRNTAFPTPPARKRWESAIKRGVKAEMIIAGAKAYAAEQSRIGKVGSGYVKTADSWLCQELWLAYTPDPALPIAKAPVISDEAWRERVQVWRDRGGHWPHRGPEPNEPGTLCPVNVLIEFGIVDQQAA